MTDQYVKVAVNRCFGGFGLSDAGYRLLAARKGLTLYPEVEGSITNYWTTPPDQRPAVLTGSAWAASQLYDKDLSRTDPDLIAVIEQLGPAASGEFAKLSVVEVPADARWHIHDSDGLEHVAEDHRTW